MAKLCSKLFQAGNRFSLAQLPNSGNGRQVFRPRTHFAAFPLVDAEPRHSKELAVVRGREPQALSMRCKTLGTPAVASGALGRFCGGGLADNLLGAFGLALERFYAALESCNFRAIGCDRLLKALGVRFEFLTGKAGNFFFEN